MGRLQRKVYEIILQDANKVEEETKMSGRVSWICLAMLFSGRNAGRWIWQWMISGEDLDITAYKEVLCIKIWHCLHWMQRVNIRFIIMDIFS